MTTANNHSLDSYIDGVHYTIDTLREYGIDPVGTQKEGEDPYLIKEVMDT